MRPDTEKKYAQAIEWYRSTRLPCVEICRLCGVTVSGFRYYMTRYHRDLLLRRHGVSCSNPEKARQIKLGPLRGPLPVTRAKYQKAVEACRQLDFIGDNLSQIARRFGLDGGGLARQLRTHYPEIWAWREQKRQELGIDDHLPRGTRSFCKKQYAEAVKRLRSDAYITVQEAAESCGVSYSGLEQHLLFYHKELVRNRIHRREQAVMQRCRGKMTGRGTPHAPHPDSVEKYAEAVELFRTTGLSAARIARQTQVSKKGFYEHLQKWHPELVSRRKQNPLPNAKYAAAIVKLKESSLSTAQVAVEYGLHPETFRAYLKAHEPALYERQGMAKTASGSVVSRRSMEKYDEAIQIYATTTQSLKSVAGRLGLNISSLRQFIQRNFPELHERHRQLVQSLKQGGGPTAVE